jgi:ribonuclease BN (tRNA processing enzyme)
MEVLFPGSWSARREFRVEALELAERAATRVGPVRVAAFPVVHPSGAPAYALRCEIGGTVVTYSGDTEWTDVLVEAASGADVFVCEAYTFAKPVKYHLSYTTLIENRHRLSCRRLILTHMSDDMLAHLGEVEAEIAEDGMVIML